MLRDDLFVFIQGSPVVSLVEKMIGRLDQVALIRVAASAKKSGKDYQADGEEADERTGAIRPSARTFTAAF
jgi:hypothetical protein